jgi:hypothetical protein
MSFRQGNKRKHEQQVTFRNWLTANEGLIGRSGLPTSVLQSRDDWAYFLFFRYHDQGNWNTPPFTSIDFVWDDLSPQEQDVVLSLEEKWSGWLERHPILAERLPAQKRP